TGKLQVFGYGYEGDVYFSNTGSMEIQGSKIIWEMNEVSINKTKSKYTATLTLETPKLLSVQTSDVIVDGKKQEDWSTKLHRKTKTTSN
ncbi:MAG: hypothetical protein QF927_09215, partial [Verrucomicrobiota bacterium]|nr:hypothetical protein [Verrucomicrobiota bacterium]